MPWVSEEEIQAAKAMSAIEYLKRFESSRLQKTKTRNEWQLKDHDSFKINEITSKWHWKSKGIGGVTALRFLMQVDEMEFTEAVRMLCDENPSYIPKEYTEKEKKPFQLPDRYLNCSRVWQYLSKRGISDEVIRYCVSLGILYESTPYHNAVFVGRDDTGKARYAFLRGIYEKEGRPFRIEQAGSEKAYAFYIPPQGQSVRVAVYEASIDAMAHMTLEQGTADKYRLSLGGISAPKEGAIQKSMKKSEALEHFLSQHPEIQEIEICTDNDFAGRWACEHIKKMYEGKYRIIENLPQIEGADYGDVAKQAMKNTVRIRKSEGRER